MKKTSTHISLWRWICVRILSLAIGTVILIAFCMWLRYAVWYFYAVDSMSPQVRQEFAQLSQNPSENTARYHSIIDTYFGEKATDPSISSSDWLMLAILVLVAIPLIVILGLKAARPLSNQFSQIAMAAKAVARGEFSKRAGIEKQAPNELTQLAEDFNSMTAQLERYENELRDSNAAMAHELRSPLTAAIGRLQGMMDGVFPADSHQISIVMRQLYQLNRLIDDLHLLSLATAGKLTLDKTPFDLNDLLDERVAWMKPRTEDTDFTIVFTRQNTANCHADPYRMGQVISILMDNALRYAREGKVLEIAVVQQVKTVNITFSDHGPGVDNLFLTQIFERFSRAETSRARNSGGSGLGLSIARAICEAHGGTLEAANGPQNGMCFVVSLPVQELAQHNSFSQRRDIR
ncbi:sensor histidine kinase [Ewingella americana]|uniref:histidine kinase n=1 Tax=Ewingella americana TaxID=41202 RepID=A0A502GVC0_9GAMM|nr:ATP-binding protein [Ewingella americana]TPG64923.1 HAMP domain-containing protein [Ewingella americana]